GTNLTIGIENGASEVVDLSSLVGTDDQTATEVTYDNTTSGLTAVDVQAAIDEVAAGSTDDQNISGSGLAGNILTIGIENGTNETVDLSALVGTDDQIASEVNITDAGGNFTSTEVEGALAELAAGSTDDQNISGSGLAGNILTIGIENGTNETVDLSALVGTDDQIASEVNITDAGGNFTSTEVEGALAELAAGSTDDQNISGSGLAGNILTIGIENGTNETVDLSALVGTDDQNLTGATLSGANILQIDIENGTSTTVDLSSLDNSGTDDQTAAEVTYDNTTSGLTAVDVQAAIDEVAAGSTDDQNISGSGLAGNILTIGIENGTNETVDLSALVGTDDQIANEVNITDAGGNFTSTEVEGALAELAAGSTDDQNISGSGLAGNILTIGIENGTNETVDLSALVGTDDQNLTGASLSGANVLQIDIENGTSTTVDLSSLDDSGTDDQTAAEVTYDNTTSGLTAVDVQAAIDEVAAGSTDDQNISGSGLAGNILTIGIENGTNETVDLSALVGTDDQIANEVNITDAGGNFTSTEVEGALAELAAGSSDDQNLTGATLNGANVLQIDIENGTSTTVDLSSLDNSGTDDQTAAEVTYDNTTSGLTAVDVQAAIDEVAAGSTDDQNISGSGLAGTNLTIGIENGTSEVVDLSSLVGTDDQNISGSGLAGNILTIGIENGTNETVDLSALVGTDDQIASEINITDAGGNFTSTEVEGALAELAAGSSDDQNLTGATLSGANVLQIDIENGASTTVDLSSLDDSGTDDQTASEVNITDAGGNFTSTEVEGALAELAAGSTDDQNISGSGLAGTNLTIGIENGTSEVVDLSSLVGTDDQNISGSGLAGNILTIGIENGTNETVDLSALVGTDDQIASEVNITDAGGNFTSTEVEGALAELAAGSTDDQNISGSGLAGNILTIGIENGTNETVDLSALLGTDDQNISGSGLAGNILTIGIENGTNETVDLSALVGTDDQIASEVNITDAGGNFTSTEVEGALAELAAGSTDDQNISGSGLAGTNLTIGIENGTSEVIDLSSLVGTDDQNLTGATLSGANILQIDIENGTSTTVDLSALDDSGTDDQTAAEVTYDNTTSGLTAVDVQAAIDEVAAASTDDQYDDEVPLRTPIDVDEGGVGSPTNETNVQEVINAIAPITSKAARIFYPPSIAVDASTNGSFSIDLYAQYTAQFGTPTVASAGAPAAVPTYGATELYYYVTYADPTVFNTATMSIDANGVLSYEIIGQPTDYNSLINVVFVVK
ncbi:beta strand repeat-containing protein, partial [Muriicola sp. E247]|uniref:beta strand repeat-containing protein n=1 Tax=Muriicola sp. E247 TaxID=3242730 RepID=UPI00352344EC